MKPLWDGDTEPDSGSAGVLIIRVWSEGAPEDPQLRVRMIVRSDVTSDAEESAWFATIPESLDYLHTWLKGYFPAP